MSQAEGSGDDSSLLMAQVAAGDAEALGHLYNRFGGPAYGLAKQLLHDTALAQEVVQDAFLTIWRHAKRFDAARGSVRAWLLTIVHHRCVTLLRGRKGSALETPLDEAIMWTEPDGVWHRVARQLDALDLRQALGDLPEEQRMVVQLAYYGGLTHDEIASQLGLPLGTVKGRMRLALAKLRAALDGHDERL